MMKCHSGKMLPSIALCAMLAGGAALADTVDWAAYGKHFYVSFPGYTGNAALNDFPVLVRLSPSLNGFDYSKCRLSNGGDLRFSDDDGNLIPSEIDTWNPNGESLVWVKVPTLTRTTVIHAHYGCDNPVSTNPQDVWDENYVGVWHLGESALPLKESSGVSTPFSTSSGSGLAYGAAGVIGGAFNMADAAQSSAVYAADDSDLTDLDNFTFEYWLKQTATGTATLSLLQKCEGSSTDLSYRIYFEKDKDPTRPNYQFSGNGTTSPLILSGNIWTDPPLNTWYFHAWSYDHATHTRLSWKDGARVAAYDTQTRSAPVYDSAAPLSLGGGFSNAFPFKGQIDELRISKIARSENWLKATYDTVHNASFAVYGNENNWAKYSHKFMISFPNAQLTETLTDFPVLVRIANNSPAGFSYADCKKSGGDLRFSDEAGNLLPSEVDTWNTSGTSLIWVKVPSLTSTTKIFAYYGWAEAPSVDSARVWDENYVGVWHLGESSLPLKESSGISTSFNTSSGSGLVYGAAGKVGGAFNMNGGAAGSAVYAADDPDLTGFENLTMEFWVRQDATYNGYMSLLGKAGGSSSDYSMRSYVGTNTKKLEMLFSYNGTSGTLTYSSWEFPALNTWYYYAFAYDHATHTRVVRRNASTVISSTTQTFGGPLYDSDAPLSLGGGVGGGAPFKGQIDELRLSKIARSAAWLKATYDTVNSSGFATCSKVRKNVLCLVIYVK